MNFESQPRTKSTDTMRNRNKHRARLLRQRQTRRGKLGQSPTGYQQLEPRQMLAVDIGLNFAGSALGVDSNSFAPNTMGAVGPDHIVELINERYTVYDKAGNPLETSNLNDFWTLTAGATISGNSIQPRIVYDPIAERFSPLPSAMKSTTRSILR